MDERQMGQAGRISSPRWYLVQSKPRQADRAEINLCNQGYQVFHPRLRIERIRRGQRIRTQESLFPNYLFIRLQPWIDDWSPLRATRGVAKMVRFGPLPLPVDDALIEEIRHRTDMHEQTPALRPSDQVEIIKGPFRGLDAIFQAYEGERRALLLINLLHCPTTLNLPLDQVIPQCA